MCQCVGEGGGRGTYSSSCCIFSGVAALCEWRMSSVALLDSLHFWHPVPFCIGPGHCMAAHCPQSGAQDASTQTVFEAPAGSAATPGHKFCPCSRCRKVLAQGFGAFGSTKWGPGFHWRSKKGPRPLLSAHHGRVAGGQRKCTNTIGKPMVCVHFREPQRGQTETMWSSSRETHRV